MAIYTCPSDRETGSFWVLTPINTQLVKASTNSYAACYGGAGLMSTFPERGTGVMYRSSKTRLNDITDGSSNTLLIGERGAFFAKAPWAGAIEAGTIRTTPGAPVYRSGIHPASTMSMARVGTRKLKDPWSELYEFFSPHGTVVNFLFADGSVHPLTTEMDVDALSALATRAGGEPTPDY